MVIDLSTKTVDELKTIIANHEKLGKIKAQRYLAAGVELAARSAGNLSLNKTVDIITAAAKDGVFLGSKDVADKSGAIWAKVHYAMTKHLLDVSRHAHRLGWPMLSAIVVDKKNVATGAMDPDAITAFCNCARALGIEVEEADEAAFVKEQQAAVFAAAKEGRLG
jgi:5-methylcytosine-specific restriction protein B